MKGIDIAKYVVAVDRQLKTVDKDGKPARMIVATRVYHTDIDDAWDALTSRERIPRWFMPIEGELEIGGRYQLKGNAGGVITTCNKPRELGLTWEMMGQVSWVEVHLEAVGSDRTKLTLQHIAHIPDAMWEEFGPGAVGVGWDGGLLGFALHVESANKDDVATEGAEWVMTDEGKRFNTLSSDEWCKASIAAGTDAAIARAAAERTTKFYTGG